jgi:hypothetical protein
MPLFIDYARCGVLSSGGNQGVTMARMKAIPTDEQTVEILRTLLILQLGVARVPRGRIRKIVGCSMGRVTDVLRHVPVEKSPKL